LSLFRSFLLCSTFLLLSQAEDLALSLGQEAAILCWLAFAYERGGWRVRVGVLRSRYRVVCCAHCCGVKGVVKLFRSLVLLRKTQSLAISFLTTALSSLRCGEVLETLGDVRFQVSKVGCTLARGTDTMQDLPRARLPTRLQIKCNAPVSLLCSQKNRLLDLAFAVSVVAVRQGVRSCLLIQRPRVRHAPIPSFSGTAIAPMLSNHPLPRLSDLHCQSTSLLQHDVTRIPSLLCNLPLGLFRVSQITHEGARLSKHGLAL
jgi:hypothetical protein